MFDRLWFELQANWSVLFTPEKMLLKSENKVVYDCGQQALLSSSAWIEIATLFPYLFCCQFRDENHTPLGWSYLVINLIKPWCHSEFMMWTCINFLTHQCRKEYWNHQHWLHLEIQFLLVKGGMLGSELLSCREIIFCLRLRESVTHNPSLLFWKSKLTVNHRVIISSELLAFSQDSDVIC